MQKDIFLPTSPWSEQLHFHLPLEGVMYVTLYVINFCYYSASIPMSPLRDSNVNDIYNKGNSIHIHNLFYCCSVYLLSVTVHQLMRMSSIVYCQPQSVIKDFGVITPHQRQQLFLCLATELQGVALRGKC